MADTPNSVRIYTQETPDGRGVYVAVPGTLGGTGPASPLFTTTLQPFDITVVLPQPTQGS